MTTAIIGTGQIGSALAGNLTRGGEPVVLASQGNDHAAALAGPLGELATAAPVADAITAADVVIIAVKPFQATRDIITENRDRLNGKVVVDPSNQYALGPDKQLLRTLPEGESSGAIVAGLLPPGAQYVKAFGTLGADTLGSAANSTPRAVLFYAADDDNAGATIERLITAAGFDPVKAGGLKDAGRLELPDGDLHQWGGLKGEVLDLDQARAAVAMTPTS